MSATTGLGATTYFLDPSAGTLAPCIEGFAVLDGSRDGELLVGFGRVGERFEARTRVGETLELWRSDTGLDCPPVLLEDWTVATCWQGLALGSSEQHTEVVATDLMTTRHRTLLSVAAHAWQRLHLEPSPNLDILAFSALGIEEGPRLLGLASEADNPPVLYLVETGSGREVARVAEAAMAWWSPGGREMLVHLQDGRGLSLVVLRADGLQILQSYGSSALVGAWVDDRRIVVGREAAESVDSSGEELRALDGRRVDGPYRGTLHIKELASGEERLIDPDVLLGGLHGPNDWAVAFDDGGSIAYVAPRDDGTFDVRVVNLSAVPPRVRTIASGIGDTVHIVGERQVVCDHL